MNILDKNKVRIDFTFQNLKKKKKRVSNCIFKNNLLPTGRKRPYLIVTVIGFFLYVLTFGAGLIFESFNF